MITMHAEYRMPGGEALVLPPIDESPSCTCGRHRRAGRDVKIVAVTFMHPDEMTREEAEQDYKANTIDRYQALDPQ